MNRCLRIPAIVVGVLAAQTVAAACPSCYGAADSPMTAGMNAAILAMLGITAMVLAGISGVFFYMWRRMKHLHDVSKELFVSEQGILQEDKDKGVVEWNNI